MTLTVTKLFAVAGLSPCGPVPWGDPCNECRPGVYVITIDQRIVYVGRTKRSLSRRLKEFYWHKYGDTRPHRGGQEILNLQGHRVVYWCVTNDPRDAELKMIRAFEDCYGRLPSGNRKRGDRSLTARKPVKNRRPKFRNISEIS